MQGSYFPLKFIVNSTKPTVLLSTVVEGEGLWGGRGGDGLG